MVLTKKLIVLLLMFGQHRRSTIVLFAVGNMTLNNMSVNFLPNQVLKNFRKGRLLGKFGYETY